MGMCKSEKLQRALSLYLRLISLPRGRQASFLFDILSFIFRCWDEADEELAAEAGPSSTAAGAS
eukprot:12159892-Prorocentrum_lima.AAC.1